MKVDPNRPDTIDNCGYLNEDGVPDVVVLDSNEKPVFVKGYKTKSCNWPDDILYYSSLPTKDDRIIIPLKPVSNLQLMLKHHHDFLI